MRDPTDLDSQERDAEATQAGAREQRERELNDLRWLMAHPQGRRIVARLLDKAHVNRTSYNHSGSAMAFAEGERNIGLFIQAEVLEAAPGGYMKLLTEYKAK